MVVFDQRCQSVTYQYNAAGDINFGAVQNRLELVAELEKLKAEFDRAVQQKAFDDERAIEAESTLKLAIVEAKKSKPNRQTLLEINGAKDLMEGATAAGGMVTALIKAADLVWKLF